MTDRCDAAQVLRGVAERTPLQHAHLEESWVVLELDEVLPVVELVVEAEHLVYPKRDLQKKTQHDGAIQRVRGSCINAVATEAALVAVDLHRLVGCARPEELALFGVHPAVAVDDVRRRAEDGGNDMQRRLLFGELCTSKKKVNRTDTAKGQQKVRECAEDKCNCLC